MLKMVRRDAEAEEEKWPGRWDAEAERQPRRWDAGEERWQGRLLQQLLVRAQRDAASPLCVAA